VVSNAKMTGPEHDALKESIKLIVGRCNVADELEKANQEVKESQKEVDENEKSN